MNRRVAGRFLDFMPSKIRLMVSICPEVDRFVRNPFWFFFQDWVDFGSYPVKEHQVVNLCWNCCQCYSAIILGDREVAFFGDWQQASFSPSIYGVLIMYIVAEIQKYLVEVICSFVSSTFHAFFFPIPEKALVESQPVSAWNDGRHLQRDSPREA